MCSRVQACRPLCRATCGGHTWSAQPCRLLVAHHFCSCLSPLAPDLSSARLNQCWQEVTARICETSVRACSQVSKPGSLLRGDSDARFMPRTVNNLLLAPAFVFDLGVAIGRVEGFRFISTLSFCGLRGAAGSYSNICSISDVRPTSGHGFPLSQRKVQCVVQRRPLGRFIFWL